MRRKRSPHFPVVAPRQNSAVGGRHSMHSGSNDGIRRSSNLLDSVALRNSLFSSLNPILEKVLSLDRLRDLYRDVRGPDGTNIFNRILQKMQVSCDDGYLQRPAGAE